MRIRINKGQDRGQVLFESLITLSVFFLFVFGILYLTLCYQTKLWLHHVSYENAVCLYYAQQQSQCLREAKQFIAQAFPYLRNVQITFQSHLGHQESLIHADFPPHLQISAKESFYAKY